MKNKFQILGLMYASKNLIIGQDAVVGAVQNNKAKCVLLSKQASERTTKKITDKCKFYNVECVIVDDQGLIAQAIGKQTVMVVATNATGFAKKMKDLKGE